MYGIQQKGEKITPISYKFHRIHKLDIYMYEGINN